MTTQRIIFGDNVEKLKAFPENSFDCCVTDGPYGLAFMNKKWDYDVPKVELWREVLRVLKPGGHVLSFGGTRTYHRMVVNMEDAGFEIRDQLAWLYGSGFPKSMDISKQIDKKAGAERQVIGKKGLKKFKGTRERLNHKYGADKRTFEEADRLTAPATDEAKQWDGWGTALKPAHEPICMARKPFSGALRVNILKWGTGGINIHESRIAFTDKQDKDSATWGRGTDILGGNYVGGTHGNGLTDIEANPAGRWPANVLLDQEAAGLLDEQSGILTTGRWRPVERENTDGWAGTMPSETNYSCEPNSGGVSRFFYVAKPSQFERNKGLSHMEKRKVNDGRQTEIDNSYQRGETERSNTHVTVKPIDLMRYLIKLVTPKGGTVLDPFNGSGSTGIACKLEHMNYVGIDNDAESCRISEARLAAWNPELYVPQKMF